MLPPHLGIGKLVTLIQDSGLRNQNWAAGATGLFPHPSAISCTQYWSTIIPPTRPRSITFLQTLLPSHTLQTRAVKSILSLQGLELKSILLHLPLLYCGSGFGDVALGALNSSLLGQGQGQGWGQETPSLRTEAIDHVLTSNLGF